VGSWKEPRKQKGANLMSAELAGPIWAAVGSVLAVGATYWFTKKREREADLRREKLAHYKAFILSLSGVLEKETSPAGQKAFSQACNNLLLFALQPVLKALQQFQLESRTSNPNRSKERHDRVLSNLLLEIRNDLEVRPKDDPKDFNVWLWASGVSEEKDEKS
jgi:hypothetical protein